MGRVLRFVMTGVGAGLASVAALPPAGAVEVLPMPVSQYSQLCKQSGGFIIIQLNNEFGTAQCVWPNEGQTACKVSANEVNACVIACESDKCLKANPDRVNPAWPLAGGPQSAPAN